MGKKDILLSEKLSPTQHKYMLGVSVSCVTFCFDSGHLKLLLCKLKTKNEWVLPSGLIAHKEDADKAALRVLKARIGVKEPYLKQFSFFGDKKRISSVKEFAECVDQEIPDYTSRFINLGYYSFVKSEDVKFLRSKVEDIKWFDVKELPRMGADCKEIINTCLQEIRRQIGFLPIGYGLLPDKFTMPELRTIYETILDKQLDRRNFQRKILSIGYIEPLNETRKIGAHKSPNLYTFKKEKYDEADKLGVQLMSNNL